MKDIKTFLIGFLTCFCLFLIMGQTKAEKDVSVVMEDIKTLLTENGRYQASSVYANYKTLGNSGGGTDLVITTIIDTRTGEIVKKVKLKSKDYDEID